DKIVVIAPGAGKSWGKDAHLKHWPAQNYSALADKVIENYSAKIIIVGDYSEKGIIQNVISGMHHAALDLSGRTSVGELAALFRGANLLITNDGGPLHMAVAVDTRTVSIFGPVDDLVYGPYPLSDKHRVAKNTISCRPCYRDFRMFPCANEQKCIHGLSVEGVFNLVKELI
ncbi:glycosyltransferase family 9 protein, partial [bacterium]